MRLNGILGSLDDCIKKQVTDRIRALTLVHYGTDDIQVELIKDTVKIQVCMKKPGYDTTKLHEEIEEMIFNMNRYGRSFSDEAIIEIHIESTTRNRFGDIWDRETQKLREEIGLGSY